MWNIVEKAETKRIKIKTTFNLEKVLEIILAIGITAVVLVMAGVNLFHYCYNINADNASEALLARLIWDSGEWIPQSWYPSTEVRILGMPNLAAMIYGAIGSLSVAAGLACTLMALGILGSAYYFALQCEFGRLERLIFILLCLIMPNHFVQLELFYLWASYYSIHVIVLFLVLGIYVQLLKRKEIKKTVCWMMVGTVAISVVLGMQGTRSMLILSGPLTAVEVIRTAVGLLKKRKMQSKELITTGWVFALLVAGVIGTCFEVSVGQDMSRNIRKGLNKLLSTVLPDIYACLGFENLGLPGKLLLWGGVILLVAELFVLIINIFLASEFKENDWVAFFLILSPSMTAVCVAFTTIDSSERYYFVLLFTVPFVLVKWLHRMHRYNRLIPVIAGIMTMVLLIRYVIVLYLPIFTSKEHEEDPRYDVVYYLEENNYCRAYATFENASAMTVLSDGKVQVAPVDSVRKMNICRWMSSTNWYVPNVPEYERTAYIVTESEKEDFQEFLDEHGKNVKFAVQIDKYLLYLSDYNYSRIDE